MRFGPSTALIGWFTLGRCSDWLLGLEIDELLANLRLSFGSRIRGECRTHELHVKLLASNRLQFNNGQLREPLSIDQS